MNKEAKEKTQPKVPSPKQTNPKNSEVSKPKKKIVKEKKEEKVPENIVEDKGVNLIPVMTKDQIEEEEQKKKVNVTSLVSVSLLLSISILVVGFNIASKIQLNNERAKLFAKEEEMALYEQYIIDNNDILDRVYLYKDIQEGAFSVKEVVEYIQDIGLKSGNSTITEISFSGASSFEFSGNSKDLEGVSKLWYLLVNDSKMENIELKSVSKSEQGSRFSFSGELKVDEFVNLNIQTDNE